MTTCQSCGAENRFSARFCDTCGAALEAAPAAREQRKTVSILFCDLTGSTELGESQDPEALRAVLARYFERMKGIVEAHGGTVEKFIGDAVMAVFGVPQVHEDDALRACRAAVEMRDALPGLGVQARIGVNTGEVVTGTEERLATGDAVNVAARLEQAAQPGEILVGEETFRLVRDAVEALPVEPLDVKGKSEPVSAHRLLAVTGELARRHTAPMVGRETELQRLGAAFGQAVHDRSCQLFTVLGAAGVGKSRLAFEFLSEVDARVVRGRCLPYGEGITYWPVVEVLKQLGTVPSDPVAAAAIHSLLGESEEGTSAEAIAWAFRKLLEEEAERQPVVVVFDDLHWAEETFFDLVEHIADLSRGAPLLVLCLARPELLDKRQGWGGGKLNATTVLLEPLDAGETDELLDALASALDDDLRERIRGAAEGNPLFVEEMLALVRESGGADLEVPPTIQALLAARLDQLAPEERNVLERGSVEGRVFHRGAVQALSNGEPQISQLTSLVRKELVRPDRSQLPGDDAYRFRHLLIRDAAYDALPKSTRADLHERFADWLDEHADLVELDEIVGHHLAEAARFKRELGQEDAALAERAGRRLGRAGTRALWRSDFASAHALLDRALELLRPLGAGIDLELKVAVAHMRRLEMTRAAGVAEAAAARAREAGDELGEAVARVVAGQARCLVAVDPDFEELEELVRAVIPRLEEAGDDESLVHVWLVAADLQNLAANNSGRAKAIEQVLRHARLAGAQPYHLFGLGGALASGAHPADDALRILDELAPAHPAPEVLSNRARLLAMLGRLDEARSLAEQAEARMTELGAPPHNADLTLAEIAEHAGDYETVERLLRRRCAVFEERELWAYLSTYAPGLGRALCKLGRYDEADPLAERGRELGAERDLATQRMWRQTKALVLSHRGEHGEAERVAREAVAYSELSDALTQHGDALWDLGEVLAAAGKRDEAIAALEEALEKYERKRNLAMVAQVEPRLAELRSSARV